MSLKSWKMTEESNSAAAASCSNARMTVTVVGGALLRISENRVGLAAFLELLLRFRIVRIAVRDDVASPACGKRS